MKRNVFGNIILLLRIYVCLTRTYLKYYFFFLYVLVFLVLILLEKYILLEIKTL